MNCFSFRRPQLAFPEKCGLDSVPMLIRLCIEGLSVMQANESLSS